MTLRGHLDDADRARVRGWAFDDAAPDVPVSLVVTAGDTVLGRVLANAFRPDLREAGLADGRCSFEFEFAGSVSPFEDHLLAVRQETDGTHLQGSPVLIERATAFDDVKASFADIARAYVTEAELAERLTFLAAQTDALLGIADFRRSGQAEQEARRKRRWLQLEAPDARAAAVPQKRALVIDARVPQASRDAGSHAVLAHMLSLQRLGFAVSFAPMDLGPPSAVLAAHGIPCLTRPWYATIEEVLARNANAFAAVYLHRADVAAIYGALVRKNQGRARILYSVADLGSLRLERQAAALETPEFLAVGRNEANKESIASFFADATITHSTAEAAILRQRHPDRTVEVVPFAVPAVPVARAFAERRGVAFVGSFDHQPNLDAAFRLIDDVMPELGRLDPTIPCLIAGSGMPQHLKAKAGGVVRILGQVPDIGSVYDTVRLTCAPLAYGAGVKGKVLESLAAGLPCACTSVAAEGLDLPSDLQALVADEPAALAALIRRLHEDKPFNTSLAAAGQAFVAAYAADDAIDAAMRRVLEPRR